MTLRDIILEELNNHKTTLIPFNSVGGKPNHYVTDSSFEDIADEICKRFNPHRYERLSVSDTLDRLREYSKELNNDPVKAKALIKSLGINNADGSLRIEYGGEYSDNHEVCNSCEGSGTVGLNEYCCDCYGKGYTIKEKNKDEA